MPTKAIIRRDVGILMIHMVHFISWQKSHSAFPPFFPSVTPSILKAMSEHQLEFTNFKRIRVAMGTWNVNGGKQFKSNILGTSELTDWLLDSPKLSGVSEFQGNKEH